MQKQLVYEVFLAIPQVYQEGFYSLADTLSQLLSLFRSLDHCFLRVSQDLLALKDRYYLNKGFQGQEILFQTSLHEYI